PRNVEESLGRAPKRSYVMSDTIASRPFAPRLPRGLASVRAAAHPSAAELRPKPVVGRRNLLLRFLDLVIESRERQAEREIARLSSAAAASSPTRSSAGPRSASPRAGASSVWRAACTSTEL